jgi:hypothetical protein
MKYEWLPQTGLSGNRFAIGFIGPLKQVQYGGSVCVFSNNTVLIQNEHFIIIF